MSKQKKIILGITGGISAYKACDIASNLVKNNIQVIPVMTESATQIISPLTLKTIAQNHCYINQFEYNSLEPLHIELVKDCDLFVLAPATANIISKLAHGIGDDLLTTMLLAYNRRLIIAPAMNTIMWENPMIQQNINIIKNNLNAEFINPVEGELACRTVGIGKLAPVDNICEIILQNLQDKQSKVLITAGGTSEHIDPVRCITNHSSGKMGQALHQAFIQSGYKADLFSVMGKSAQQVFEELQNIHQNYDAIIMAAAISDYTPTIQSNQKIKKSQNNNLIIELKKTTDIISWLSKNKLPEQKIIGFGAESENIFEHAKSKLQAKNLDYIILNDISRKDIGFNSMHNEVHIINKDLDIISLEKNTKDNITKQIVELLKLS